MAKIASPWGTKLSIALRAPGRVNIVRDRFVLFGVTKTNLGVPLANCAVHVFNSEDDLVVGQDVSDGSGNWVFSVSPSSVSYAVAYKAGSPDVTGATKNALAADGVSVPIYLRDPTVSEGVGYSRGRVVNQ